MLDRQLVAGGPWGRSWENDKSHGTSLTLSGEVRLAAGHEVGMVSIQK